MSNKEAAISAGVELSRERENLFYFIADRYAITEPRCDPTSASRARMGFSKRRVVEWVVTVPVERWYAKELGVICNT